MEDSASNIRSTRETESLAVWVKPAAFYNTLESRYKQNRYLLKRCLNYRHTTPVETPEWEGALEVEFMDLARATSSETGTEKRRPMRLTVIAALCESDTERDFRPFEARRMHLKRHNNVCATFNAQQRPVSLLMIVKEMHHDMSVLFPPSASQELSTELTKKWCFGCLPVGERIWWTCHSIPGNGSTKMKVHQWMRGVVTLGEKSVWDGFRQRQTTLLSIDRCEEPATHCTPPCMFTVQCTNKPTLTAPVKSLPEEPTRYRPSSDEVAFRFVFGVAQPQCVEQRTQQYGCPFCTMKCRNLTGLRYHLAASHDLFVYEIETGPLTVIWVRRRTDIYDCRGDIFCPNTKKLISAHEKAFYMNKAAYLRAKPVNKRQRLAAEPAQSSALPFDELEETGQAKRRPSPYTTAKASSAKAIP